VRILGDPLKSIGNSLDGIDDNPDKFPVDSVLSALTLTLASRIRPALHYLSPPAIVYAQVDETKIPLQAVLAAEAGTKLSALEAPKAGAEGGAAGAGGGAVGAGGGTESDKAPAKPGINIFAMLLPMVSVLSVLFLGEAGMRDFLAEQQAGTLKRQFTSPVRVAEVFAAKVVYTLIVVAGALAVLGVVGTALGWIPSSISIAGALVQLAALGFASAGLAALIYGFVRSERAARSTYSAVAMGMSFVGGSFVPSSELPPPLKTLGLVTVNHWGIQGLTDLTVRNGGLRDILPEAGVLLLYGLVGVTLGWLRLSRRFASGRAA
jgi:ABC-type multidrug transport system permease subunit